ncbi:MAG: hypothetical protein JSS29_06560 [Proteobacteria bacterium]|nr:hypothetical protein [Pseudomonadota bacterium]
MRTNYQQVRKQREFAKKQRQQEKEQRRTARLSAAAPPEEKTAQKDNPAVTSETRLGSSS